MTQRGIRVTLYVVDVTKGSEFNGTQHIDWLHLDGLTGKPTEPCLIGIISLDLIVMPDEMGLSICQLILRIAVQLLLTSNPWRKERN